MYPLLLALLFLSISLILWRFFVGPDAPNRILAWDALTISSTALFVLLALHTGRAVYLDVAFVFAMVGFAGVLLFGRVMEKGI